MEALVEEAVESSNTDFVIDLVQTMNEKIMNEKLRSGKYIPICFLPRKLEIILGLEYFKTYFLNQIDSKCVVISGSQKGKPCVFKGFKVRGKSQNTCVPYSGKYWCATELRKNGKYKKWGYCRSHILVTFPSHLKKIYIPY